MKISEHFGTSVKWLSVLIVFLLSIGNVTQAQVNKDFKILELKGGDDKTVMSMSFIKNLTLFLLLFLITNAYSQYPGFKDVKQLYNHLWGVDIDQMFSIGEYKYLYTSKLTKMTRSIIYDDVALWENENVGDKFKGRFLIKVDKQNNYIAHKVLLKSTWGAIAEDNGIIYYTEYEDDDSPVYIKGVNEDLEEVFEIETKNFGINYIIVRNLNLYIGGVVKKYGMGDGNAYVDGHYVGEPASSAVGVVIKYDMSKSKVIYNIDYGHTYFFSLRAMELTKEEELIFCGNWVCCKFCVLGDTIFNNAPFLNLSTDSYIVKIKKDGTLGFLNQLHGTQGEGIYKMKLDETNNVYLYCTSKSDSLFYNDSLVTHTDVGKRVGIMKLSNDGDLQWYDECSRTAYFRLSEFQEIDNELFLLASYEEEFTFNDHHFKGGPGVVILILDKETGKVLNKEIIKNEGNINYSTIINDEQLTCSIGIYGSPSNYIEFDNGVKIKYGNTYLDGGTFIFNIDRSIVNIVEENNHLAKFRALPNPVSRNDILYIEPEGYVQGYTISLHNNSGQEVYRTSNSKMIDLTKINNIQSGLYYLTIETDKGKITKKIIIH